MYCKRCGVEQYPDAKFCRGCGERIERRKPAASTSADTCGGRRTEPASADAAAPISPDLTNAQRVGGESAVGQRSHGSSDVYRAPPAHPTVAGAFVAGAIMVCAVLGAGGYWYWNQQAVVAAERAEQRVTETARLTREANERAAAVAAAAREEEARKTRELESVAPAAVPADPVTSGGLQADVPITNNAPPPSPSLQDLATQCGDVQACAEVMMQAAGPKKNGEAIQLASTRISAFEKPQQGDRKAARSLNAKALEAMGSGKAQEAADILRKAAAADPRDVEIQSNLGLVLLKVGGAQEARLALLAALLLDPRRTSTWAPFAIVADQLGRGDQSSAALLLAYEFSANKQKTVEYFKSRATSFEESASMRAVYDKALTLVEAGY